MLWHHTAFTARYISASPNPASGARIQDSSLQLIPHWRWICLCGCVQIRKQAVLTISLSAFVNLMHEHTEARPIKPRPHRSCCTTEGGSHAGFVEDRRGTSSESSCLCWDKMFREGRRVHKEEYCWWGGASYPFKHIGCITHLCCWELCCCTGLSLTVCPKVFLWKLCLANTFVLWIC